MVSNIDGSSDIADFLNFNFQMLQVRQLRPLCVSQIISSLMRALSNGIVVNVRSHRVSS